MGSLTLFVEWIRVVMGKVGEGKEEKEGKEGDLWLVCEMNKKQNIKK